MTAKRRYCPKSHDTFEVGRDSSYRCLKCKREAGAAAARVRRAAELAVRDAERLRQAEEDAAAEAVARFVAIGSMSWVTDQANRVRRLGLKPGSHLCEWPGDTCDRRTGLIYCSRHMREGRREAARAAVEAVRRRWAATNGRSHTWPGIAE